MLSTVNASDVLEIVVVTVGIILVLKKIVDMDDYHWVRVVALTCILSVVVIFLINALWLGVGNPGLSNCVVDFDDPRPHYEVTEF